MRHGKVTPACLILQEIKTMDRNFVPWPALPYGNIVHICTASNAKNLETVSYPQHPTEMKLIQLVQIGEFEQMSLFQINEAIQNGRVSVDAILVKEHLGEAVVLKWGPFP